MTPEVVVIGEVLVEISSPGPLRARTPVMLDFSGDALNAAAAAAATGAHTALMASVPDDALGDALVDRVRALGIDASGVVRRPAQHGVYFVETDPNGEREFVYVRRGSAGSALSAADLDDDLLSSARVVVASGVTCAISTTARQAVLHAAQRARRFVYDPNFRPRLTTPQDARDVLTRLAPYAEVITPSWPGEARRLLGMPDDASAADAARAALALGSGGVVLTCGAAGAVVATATRTEVVPPVPAEQVVDQTGAGDCLTGTLAARLALGDELTAAVASGVAAASFSLRGAGGTGHLTTEG
jgi:2-dehydro-3-deoxygluconokinase